MSSAHTTEGARELVVERGGARIRLQALGEATVRVEIARTDGSFCNDPSFTVQDRAFGSCRFDSPARDAVDALPGTHEAVASFCGLTLAMPISSDDPARSITDLIVYADEHQVYAARSDRGLIATPPQPDALPRPAEAGRVWALHDRPRVIPPSFGATAPPPGVERSTDAWMVEEHALDLYLVACDHDYDLLVREVLALTGRAPLPPRWTFGLWHSRYYPYTEESALELIDEYEARDIPLDVFVVDTDWRVGASRGYEISTEHFPDMERFLRRCTDRGIRTLFNDHPEPRGLEPLDAELFSYRQQNLTRILDMGLTTWWFDRNWGDIIRGPADGLETAVWGQKLYYDIMTARPGDSRVVLLSMVSPHPAAHRYPLHWTGDIRSDWQTLATAVRDSVGEGYQLRAYTGQDLGGHCGFPSAEQYVRWLQWGAVSPTMRLHCGPRNRFREPWRFGERASAIAAEYIRFRYRLLPLLYTLAYENHREGRPLLRGMELADANPPSWTHETEFLLGEDLLFAPVTAPAAIDARERHPFHFADPLRRRVWRRAQDGWVGRRGHEAPDRQADEIGFEHEIRFDALNASELRKRWGDGFYAVWDGSFAVEQPGWYRISLRGNGRKGLTIDGDEYPHLLRLFDGGYQEANLWLSAGVHDLLCSYEHDEGVITEIALSIAPVVPLDELPPVRSSVWLPPGRWRDLWDGTVYDGPAVVAVEAGAHQLPAFVRLGAIVPVAPVRPRTAGLERIVCDVFADSLDFTATTAIYDDDGETNAYLRGDFSLVTVRVERAGTRISVEIDADAARLPVRFRVHLPPGERVAGGSGRRLDAASAGARTVPLALSDEVAHFRESETVVVELAAGERRAEVVVEAGA